MKIIKSSVPGVVILISLLFSCNSQQEPANDPSFKIISEIKNDTKSPFYIPVEDYPKERKSLPIGVFDSGTGGLTVLNTIFEMDKYNNGSHTDGGDGELDFNAERFIYLADESNMPYGRYDAEGKAEFLRELVIKDVRFLLGDNYFKSPGDSEPINDKQEVKVIVIACNTATAYGLETVQEAVDFWGLDIEIMGIVDAGSKALVLDLEDPENKVLGVLATEGTCASQGYPKAIKRNFTSGEIAVIQQAGIGLAGAIDGDLNYIDPSASSPRDSKSYQGPDIGHAKYPLDETLWQEYNFEEGNSLMVETNENGERVHAQLNSVNNYIRYMVTHMVKNAIDEYPNKKLSRVILGCTHYPYFTEQIKEHFLYLKSLNPTYDALIDENIQFVDPSESLAAELYQYLAENDLWGNDKNENSEFYISVPNSLLDENEINDKGEFPYDYKYGRTENSSLQYVKLVPFSNEWIGEPIRERMKANIPYTYKMIYNNQ
ncbi:MAG: Asp/Glu/hydantoin racemase [Bacteroidetes bacterium]|nr:MAG: Asp/Glu/hydantoin racemase [Bacteroidota bacterium]